MRFFVFFILPEASSRSLQQVCKQQSSGETALLRRLAWAFAGRLCDKYFFSCAGLFLQDNFDYSFELPHMDYGVVQTVVQVW